MCRPARDAASMLDQDELEELIVKLALILVWFLYDY